MWKPLFAAIVLVVAACSPTSADTTTTTTTASDGTTTTSGADATTTTTPGGTSTTTPGATTTTTAAPTTTTKAPATTTTAAGGTTTTTVAGSTTTTTVAGDNTPPTIEIISPVHLSAHVASWDPDQSDFGAYVSLSATVDDPDGDPVTVTWKSNIDGALGAGKAILAFLSTAGSDSAQPIITATATDSKGATTTATVQIIVWIPSDS